MPKAEREAILAKEKAVRDAGIKSDWRPTYWFWLWMEDGGTDLIAPDDGKGLSEKLIAERARAGCLCAERRAMACDAGAFPPPKCTGRE